MVATLRSTLGVNKNLGYLKTLGKKKLVCIC